MRSVLNKPLLAGGPLKNGFWPSTRYEEELEDQFLDDGTVREELAEDLPFVGLR